MHRSLGYSCYKPAVLEGMPGMAAGELGGYCTHLRSSFLVAGSDTLENSHSDKIWCPS